MLWVSPILDFAIPLLLLIVTMMYTLYMRKQVDIMKKTYESMIENERKSTKRQLWKI